MPSSYLRSRPVSTKNGLDLPRLVEAMRRSRWMLERPRANMREMVRAYTGYHWAEEGAPQAQPINLLALFVQIVGRSLISKDPRVSLSTFDRMLRPLVKAMEQWCNSEIDKMRLAKTLRRVVTDSLFSIGICKVALATPSDAAHENWRPVAGQPFVCPVLLDDYAVDPHARHEDEVGFEGHRYRVPLDTVRDSKLYTKARKELTESADNPFNETGDERIGMLGRGYRAEAQTSEYVAHVDLWEVFVPSHRIIVTLADNWLTGADLPTGASDEGLRVQEWIGHERGPYAKLRLGEVPGNLMPKAPAQDLYDLHETVNITYRKIEQTTDRIKELLLVMGGALEDGSRVQQASDGDILRCDNPEMMKQVVMGGQAIQQLLAVVMDARERFNQQAGNLDILGGLAPQSKTAHQDAMLNANSSQGIQDYQQTTVEFVSDVVERLCWYFHHDPFRMMKAPYAPAGLPNFQYQRQVSPAQRAGIKFEDLQIKVDPYSMKHTSPQERLANINQLVTQIYLPLAQLAAQQGVSFQVGEYFAKAGKWMDEPELDELFTIVNPAQPQQGQGGGAAEAGGMPQSTTRNYVRESRPGRTENGQTMLSALLKVNPGGAAETAGNGKVK